MRDIDNARQLLALAVEDVRAMEVLKDAGEDVSARIFGFHAQQAVEKALKAWLSLAGVTYPLTHSLNVLFGLLSDAAGADAGAFGDLETLTPFAVQFRYGAYEEDEAQIDWDQLACRIGELIVYVTRLADQ
jgi:HEPN domain-containing protein